jgi:hypothetical protein
MKVAAATILGIFLSFFCLESKAQDTLFSNSVTTDIQRAAFPGGEAAMLGFIMDNIHYPSQALEYNITGTVVAKVFIDTSGNIIKTSILKGIGFGCDEEVLRVLDSLPRFTPSVHLVTGQKYIQEIIIPVKFRNGKSYETIYFQLNKVAVAPTIITEDGNMNFEDYLRKHLRFPADQKKKVTSLIALIKVDRFGEIIYELNTDVPESFRTEAKRVLDSITKVSPAMNAKTPVNCQFVVEMYFYPEKK